MRYMQRFEGDGTALGAGSIDGLRYQENIAMCATHQLTMGLVNASNKKGKGVPEQFLVAVDRAVVEQDAIGDQLERSLYSW